MTALQGFAGGTATATTPAEPGAVAAARQPGACGPLVAKPDGTAWDCTFAEDFSGSALDRTTWTAETSMTSGEGGALACYVDDKSTVSVGGGALQLSVRKASKPLTCDGQRGRYAAGSVSTFWRFSQQHGRFEARMRNTATTAPGLQEAFWLWPDVRQSTGTWPAAGEIDVAETYSQHPSLAIPFLHYTADDNGGPVPGLNTAWDCIAQRGEWNTYTLVWDAERLEVQVNDRTCLVNTSGDPAFQKSYILALTQGLGSGTNAYAGGAPMPASMQVDYVRAWR